MFGFGLFNYELDELDDFFAMRLDRVSLRVICSAVGVLCHHIFHRMKMSEIRSKKRTR